MPVFRVLCRKDAFIDYVAEIEAKDAEEASALANDSPSSYTWQSEGQQEFDAALYVTLNGDGDEIEGTECGDLATC